MRILVKGVAPDNEIFEAVVVAEDFRDVEGELRENSNIVVDPWDKFHMILRELGLEAHENDGDYERVLVIVVNEIGS